MRYRVEGLRIILMLDHLVDGPPVDGPPVTLVQAKKFLDELDAERASLAAAVEELVAKLDVKRIGRD
jgi:hypothetical protein